MKFHPICLVSLCALLLLLCPVFSTAKGEPLRVLQAPIAAQAWTAAVAREHFEMNAGQWPDALRFVANQRKQRMHFFAKEMIWQHAHDTIKMQWINGRADLNVTGEARLPTTVNYLRGRNQTDWQQNVPTFAKLKYASVYSGVDLVFYWRNHQLEYDFVISPGTDVSQIICKFSGARHMSLNQQGDLVLQLNDGELRHQKPVAYQMVNAEKRIVAAAFGLNQNGEVRFKIGAYDPALPLVIDPGLTYSSYLGGEDFDEISAVSVDSSGNIYVAGITSSLTYPQTTGAFQSALKGATDIIVTKLNPAGTTILTSTYLGGTNNENLRGMTLDAGNNIYLTGATSSTDFPLTAGAIRSTPNGGEAFVTKLNASGSGLVYSTFLGGSGNDIAYGIAVDNANSAYVTGSTTSTNFPVTTGAYQTTLQGGSFDGFVSKINPTGTALVYSTYLGGSGVEAGNAIAVDTSGNAYVTGYTTSANYPVSVGAYQTTYNGVTNVSDAFVTKLNATGTALVYSTFLGGRSSDSAVAIALDASGNAYVAGSTTGTATSNDFPTTTGAYQTTFRPHTITGPASDAFVSKFNATGTALIFSTYLGGNGTDRVSGIAINSLGSVYVTGQTGSTNFPVTAGTFKGYGGGIDAFIAQLDAQGAALAYSTYLGGSGYDAGSAIALDPTGNVYAVGVTSSASFPVVAGALQSTYGQVQDGYVVILKESGSVMTANVSAASFRDVPMAREAIVSVFGTGLATRTEAAADSDPSTPGIQLPTSLGGTTITVKDREGIIRNAPLFFVSPGQINYQVPPGTPVGTALITVTSENGTSSIGTIQVVDVLPDVFTADSTGRGPAVGYAVRVKANNQQIEEALVRSTGPNQWELLPLDLGADQGANTDQVFLVLFGTGWRFRKDPPVVSATIGGVTARVDYAKNHCCFIGVDQVNLLVPRALIGRGQVDVVLTIDGQTTLPIKIAIK